MPQAADYRERWNEISADGFAGALRAGASVTLEEYLAEFHPLVDLSDFAAGLAPALDLEGLLIPRDAPPFLSLESEGRLLRPQPELGNRLAFYCDGSGNPLCIEPASGGGSVVWLDHEMDFTGRIFVNSSAVTFAETLLIANAVQLGRSSYVDSVSALDPSAMAPGSFWAGEMPRLIKC